MQKISFAIMRNASRVQYLIQQVLVYGLGTGDLIYRKNIRVQIIDDLPQIIIFSINVIITAGTIACVISVIQQIILNYSQRILSLQKKHGNEECNNDDEFSHKILELDKCSKRNATCFRTFL
jgi:hypothetical protein